jgi:hypothetical protein
MAYDFTLRAYISFSTRNTYLLLRTSIPKRRGTASSTTGMTVNDQQALHRNAVELIEAHTLYFGERPVFDGNDVPQTPIGLTCLIVVENTPY